MPIKSHFIWFVEFVSLLNHQTRSKVMQPAVYLTQLRHDFIETGFTLRCIQHLHVVMATQEPLHTYIVELTLQPTACRQKPTPRGTDQ